MIEKFKIIKRLGGGAFGSTFLVEVLDRKVRNDCGQQFIVVKKPHDKGKEKALISELIVNAVLHTQLLNVQQSSTNNIVRYLGFDLFQEFYGMLMEYVEGDSLRTILGDVGSQNPLPIERALDIAEQICEGLMEIHKFHIIHRDIKPENILLSKTDGSVKIADLGIARILESEQLAKTFAGTPYYMPKEIINGEGADFFSDVYSLGIVMYEMLTGELPFTGKTSYEVEHKICTASPKQPIEINSKIDQKLNQIIMKTIAKEPEKRYQSAENLLRALRFYRSGKDEEEEEIDKSVFEIQEQFISGKCKALEAEKKIKDLIVKYPQKPKSFIALGEFYNRCQRYQDAIRAFNKAIERKPDFALAYRNIALSLFATGQKNDAIANLKKALKLGLEQSIEKHALKLLELWGKGSNCQ